MKRFSFCDSSVSLLYPPQEKEMVYSSEFQAMLDGLEEDDCLEESGGMNGKKRRLSVEQVHALEKVFEVDNKLEPDRKVKIARDLGLQPRQVAIWFQNRRARYKTKQLERDFNLLKANYETLQIDYKKVEQQNEDLIAELKGLREKLLVVEENNHSAGEDSCLLASHNHHDHDYLAPRNSGDGSSDSDSSGGLNNNYEILLDNSYSSFNLQQPLMTKSSSIYLQPQFVRMEADQIGSLFTEESCNIFSLDQPPNLYWYCGDYRNQ
ncbi:unnamed protein product [Cuscuta epithymum]|uniref:Homeobox-leucine zipper protein n=1 Tax=Cuscuta epithymum TaxID=186058 RepID=A0AAV0CUH9_9ASTE|nr:unnamed protein product [Cuscuta epithymum]